MLFEYVYMSGPKKVSVPKYYSVCWVFGLPSLHYTLY